MASLFLMYNFRFIKKVEHSWKALVHDGVRTVATHCTPAFGECESACVTHQ